MGEEDESFWEVIVCWKLIYVITERAFKKWLIQMALK